MVYFSFYFYNKLYTFTLIFFALSANFNEETVYEKKFLEKEQFMMMEVRKLPVRESLRSRVILESLKGIC